MHKVRKRNGSIVPSDISKITQMIDRASEGIDINTDISLFLPIFGDSVLSTTDIIESIAFAIRSQIPTVDYKEAKKLDLVLANITIMDLDKEISHSRRGVCFPRDKEIEFGYSDFEKVLEFIINNKKLQKELRLAPRLIENLKLLSSTKLEDKSLLSFVVDIIRDEDPTKLNRLTSSMIVTYKDLFAVKLGDKPFIKFHEYHLLSAIQLTDFNLFGNYLSYLEVVKRKFKYLLTTISMASPIRTSILVQNGALTSCEILNPDDDLESISTVLADFKRGSKNGRGFGLYIGNLRGKGDSINNVRGIAGGSYMYALEFKSATQSTKQGNLRKAGLTIYQDVFHSDIDEYIRAKSQQGNVRLKIWEINRGFNYPDEFFRREEDNADWFAISPKESESLLGKPLNKMFGSEFAQAMDRLERINNERTEIDTLKVFNAKSFFKEQIRMMIEEGDPYLFFRDTANRYHMNDHIGNIYCSNLCSEIVGVQRLSSPKVYQLGALGLEERKSVLDSITDDDIGYNPTCNLCSVSLLQFYYASDEEKQVIMDDVVSMMKIVLDNTKATDLESAKYDRDFNPIGIGAMDLVSLMIREEIPYRDTPKTHKFLRDLFFDFSYYAYRASMKLAQKFGSYPKFKGSKYSKGILLPQVDRDDLTPDQRAKLSNLANDIKQMGLYNGYLLAIAPNSGTSLATGQTASIYPLNRIVNLNDSLANDVFIIPKIEDLDHPDVWLLQYLSENVKLTDLAFVYTTIGKFLDQSISAQVNYNLHKHKPKDLYDFCKKMWRGGAKTIYYAKPQTTICENCEN